MKILKFLERFDYPIAAFTACKLSNKEKQRILERLVNDNFFKLCFQQGKVEYVRLLIHDKRITREVKLLAMYQCLSFSIHDQVLGTIPDAANYTKALNSEYKELQDKYNNFAAETRNQNFSDYAEAMLEAVWNGLPTFDINLIYPSIILNGFQRLFEKLLSLPQYFLYAIKTPLSFLYLIPNQEYYLRRILETPGFNITSNSIIAAIFNNAFNKITDPPIYRLLIESSYLTQKVSLSILATVPTILRLYIKHKCFQYNPEDFLCVCHQGDPGAVAVFMTSGWVDYKTMRLGLDVLNKRKFTGLIYLVEQAILNYQDTQSYSVKLKDKNKEQTIILNTKLKNPGVGQVLNEEEPIVIDLCQSDLNISEILEIFDRSTPEEGLMSFPAKNTPRLSEPDLKQLWKMLLPESKWQNSLINLLNIP